MNDRYTTKAGVMGWPIGHSRSPRLHGYWLNKYGIEGTYEALAVEPNKLQWALREMPSQGFCGVNLTIPHKEAAMKIVDRIDDVAKRIGAVNTVIVGVDGKLEGRNTDAYGFTQNLMARGVKIKDKPVTVLGAGGAARAVIVALHNMGAGKIYLLNRTQERAEQLRDILGGAIEVLPWERGEASVKDSGLLVNTTSLGMQGQPPLEFRIDGLPLEAAVADLVYAPLETDLLRSAHRRGHTTVDGLGMLLHQARPAFQAFFGKDPEVTEQLRSYVLEGK